ncbi:MAG: glycine C-acetyltransferase [Actinomycetota bacterium]|nr:glycine C-acetyltransferase [Actinomycetota bacterium]
MSRDMLKRPTGESVTTAKLAHLSHELQDLRARGIFHSPRIFDGLQAPRCRIDGREVINLASNNYLNLAADARLRDAAADALGRYGVGSGSVRPIAGTMDVHVELEQRLAAFKHSEAALVFQSGFTANAGTVGAILGPEDTIVSDALNHASIIDGCRLSKAKILVYRHRDVDHAREQLRTARAEKSRRVLLVTDGVFSMDGDIAPLPELADLADEYGAIFMVDDAHSSGVLGRNGRGSVDHFDLHGRVDIQVGTLSKAFGVVGGYVAGPRDLIDYLTQVGRPYLFSTSHPPAVAAACLAALDILESDSNLIERLWAKTDSFKQALTNLGFDTGNSETPITPILLGDEAVAVAFARALFERGVFAPGLVFPTVPRGNARVRTIVTVGHTDAELAEAVDAFEQVRRDVATQPLLAEA